MLSIAQNNLTQLLAQYEKNPIRYPQDLENRKEKLKKIQDDIKKANSFIGRLLSKKEPHATPLVHTPTIQVTPSSQAKAPPKKRTTPFRPRT
jgi:hypothetical protein